MKQEDLLKTLISQLIAMNETHYEYTDNSTNFVIDSKKPNPNELVINVKVQDNKDKKEFEKFIDNMIDWLKDFLPNLLGAVIILIVGMWLSGVIAKIVSRG